MNIDQDIGPDADAATALPVVDLTSCAREPIHALGGIQPFGFLIAVAVDWIVTRVSANAPGFLGRPVADMLGAPLSDVFSADAIHAIRGRLQSVRGPDAVEQAFGVTLQDGGPAFSLSIHVSGTSIVIEAERTVIEDISAATLVRGMLGRLQRSASFEAFCNEAVRQMRALTGFDRLMVYRFDDDGAGEVIAESVRSSLSPYLGLRYPASDIPPQARALYQRNWLRIVADVNAAVVPVLPLLSPDGQPLDLSMSMLRAVSPIHLEYLRNMGVAASLSVSIMRGGKLWGLFAAHHMIPRNLSLERRTAAELFGQTFSLALESREREIDAAYEARAREMHNQLMTAMAAGGMSLEHIADFLDELSGLVTCDGIGVWIDGEATLRGMTPTREEFSGLVRHLNQAPASQAFASRELGRFYAPAASFTDRAAGLLAIPISRTPRDYLVFFRREVTHTVTWAGNPQKSVEASPDGTRLSPRKSFEAWREVVHGQCVAWTAADLRIAEALRITLLEVILRLTDSADKDRKSSQERQELLIAELNHRVRNILGLIRGVVAQSRSDASTVEHYATVVGDRIQALARAHDQITNINWGPGSLNDLILSEAGAYLGARADRVRLHGNDILLEPIAFSTLALVLHELMTNSAKYGALCDSRGRIDVDWARDQSGRLVIDWRESGGPPVQQPTRRGFGSTIIERSIPHELRGEASVRYEPAGVEAQLILPAAYLRAAPLERLSTAEKARQPVIRAPFNLAGTVLLVEDNLVIGLDTEEMLQTMGALRVEIISSVDESLRWLLHQRPTVALLDMNLGLETSLPIAERLLELAVPFAFATGYGDSIRLPAPLAGIPIIRKPYTVETLRDGLRTANPPEPLPDATPH